MRVPLLPFLALLAVAVLGGVGLATFRYAEGLSYLSSDPAACAHCHVMALHYDSWQKSSHRAVAGCVDCHLPHDLVAKYVAKAENGCKHSRAFTLGGFPEPIRISGKNAEILQESCLGCHGGLLSAQTAATRAAHGGGAPRCVHCHAAVGHGEHTGIGAPFEKGRREGKRR